MKSLDIFNVWRGFVEFELERGRLHLEWNKFVLMLLCSSSLINADGDKSLDDM